MGGLIAEGPTFKAGGAWYLSWWWRVRINAARRSVNVASIRRLR